MLTARQIEYNGKIPNQSWTDKERKRWYTLNDETKKEGIECTPSIVKKQDMKLRKKHIKKISKNDVRASANLEQHHHPKEKIEILNYTIDEVGIDIHQGKLLDAFAGEEGVGNLTPVYRKLGAKVTPLSLSTTGDTYKHIHTLVGEDKRYDVIDLDPYTDPYFLIQPSIELMNINCILYLTVNRNTPRNGACIANNLFHWGTEGKIQIHNISSVLTGLATDRGYIASCIIWKNIRSDYRGGIIRSAWKFKWKGSNFLNNTPNKGS